jgi:hypothetical protein
LAVSLGATVCTVNSGDRSGRGRVERLCDGVEVERAGALFDHPACGLEPIQKSNLGRLQLATRLAEFDFCRISPSLADRP